MHLNFVIEQETNMQCLQAFFIYRLLGYIHDKDRQLQTQASLYICIYIFLSTLVFKTSLEYLTASP